MEHPSQKIISLIEEILLLLKLCDTRDCKYYHDFLEYTLNQLNKPHELDKIAENILRAYGGMATFSDVVICNGGKLLPTEDLKFGDLRESLFLACEDVIAKSRQ